MEATISSIMNHRSVHMRDRASVEKKLRHLISGGDRQFAVISDFDFTLTRFVDEQGKKCLTSHSVVDQLLISLHPELEEMIHARTKKYSAIEFDTNMTKEDKIPYMIEWWTLAHNNYIASGIHKDDIERAVQHSKIELRDGAMALLHHLIRSSIPLLLFSAGVGNVIEAFLRQHLHSVPANIHIISNMLIFDEEGKAVGISEPLIHVFCKDSTVIPKNAPFFDDIAHRGNILLLGDSLGDLHMDVGVPHSGTVLKIGFLNVKKDIVLEKFLDGFDIVLVEDPTMDVPDLILQALLKNSE